MNEEIYLNKKGRQYFRRVLCDILVVSFVNPLIVQLVGSQRTQREQHKEHDENVAGREYAGK